MSPQPRQVCSILDAQVLMLPTRSPRGAALAMRRRLPVGSEPPRLRKSQNWFHLPLKATPQKPQFVRSGLLATPRHCPWIRGAWRQTVWRVAGRIRRHLGGKLVPRNVAAAKKSPFRSVWTAPHDEAFDRGCLSPSEGWRRWSHYRGPRDQGRPLARHPQHLAVSSIVPSSRGVR